MEKFAVGGFQKEESLDSLQTLRGFLSTVTSRFMTVSWRLSSLPRVSLPPDPLPSSIHLVGSSPQIEGKRAPPQLSDILAGRPISIP